MRRGVVALGLAVIAFAALTLAPLAQGKATNQVTDFAVGDQGTVVEWQFLVCLTRPQRLKFEVRYKDLQTEVLRLNDSFKSKSQGRGCKRHRLTLPESKFTTGHQYRTRVTVLLRGRLRVLESKYRTFFVA